MSPVSYFSEFHSSCLGSLLIIYFAKLKSFGGQPHECRRAGFYLHILWKQHNLHRFWLYAEQTIDLRSEFRAMKTQSVAGLILAHYHVWSHEAGINSMFVTLAVLRDIEPEN